MDKNRGVHYRRSLSASACLCCVVAILVVSFPCRYLACQQESPKEEEALFIAQKAIDDGFYEVALTLFERFLKSYPGSKKISEVNFYIAQCYFYQNRFLDALKRLEELYNNPEAASLKDAVLYWMAEVHFKGNNFSKAASYYKSIIDQFPKSKYFVSAYYSLGWCFFQEGRFQEALAQFVYVEEKFPRDPQVQDAALKIVECLYNLKDYAVLKEKSKIYLKTYAKDTTKVAYLYFYLAEAEYYLGNFNEAIDGYAKVIAKSTDEKIKSLSQLGSGWAYLKMKQYEQAGNVFSGIRVDTLEPHSQDVLYLGKAILSFETRKYRDAAASYSQLVASALDPSVVLQAYLGKADSLYNLENYKEAQDAYRGGLSKVPSLEAPNSEIADKLHYGLAWALFKQGEYKEAIREFQKIVKQSEDKIVKVSALCQIGDAYQDSGEYKKAQETYDTILKEYPDSLYSDYVQYQLGLTLVKDANYDGAILALRGLVTHYPSSTLLDDATYALGLAYFQKQDYESARELFERFEGEFKGSNLLPQATYLLGTSLYNLGEFNAAIEAFKNITRACNQDIELCQKAEYEIADCYYQLGDEKEAMQRFKMLRTKYPDSRLTAEIIWWLGEYYYRHNDLSLASRYFSALIQDFPKSTLVTDAYYILGSIYGQQGRFEEALKYYKTVKEVGKSDLAGQAAIAIASLYVKQGLTEDALRMYENTVLEYPNLVSMVYPQMANLYYTLKRYAQALEYYKKSLLVVSAREVPEIQFKIAELMQAQGSEKDAVEEYLKVAYLYPDNTSLVVKSLLRVAQVYEQGGNLKEAERIYQKVVAMNVPESKFALEQLELLKGQKR